MRASTINTEVYDDRDPPRFYEIQTFYILQSDRKLGNTIMTSNIAIQSEQICLNIKRKTE